LNTKKAIRKILFVALWLAIGGGMLTLLIAAIGKQKKDQCRDYAIRIKGEQNKFFIDDKDVLKLLKAATDGNVKGQAKSSFNLRRMEQLLEDNVWIKDAELYFDNRNVLHVSVTEREPVARIFTTAGRSFYIDESEKMMPLSDKLSAKVPVFTGFPGNKVLARKDSNLLHDVKTTATFILHDPFWMAQVSQVDITPEKNFEMTPVIGNHTVLLGNGENIDSKFNRLFVFYKNILSKTGFDKYKAINVQYAGQVIGIKDNGISKADRDQMKLNVEKLLSQAREVQSDSVIAAKDIKEQKAIKVDPEIAATEKIITEENPPNVEHKNIESFTNPVPLTNPVTMKPFLNPKPGEKKSETNPKPSNEKKEPKAVMKKSQKPEVGSQNEP
jgi:cell division protein FtsQ